MEYRYNCQVMKADGSQEEESKNYQTKAEMLQLVNDMTDGDELVIQCVEYTGGI